MPSWVCTEWVCVYLSGHRQSSECLLKCAQSGCAYTWVGTGNHHNAFLSVHRVGTQSGCVHTWVGTCKFQNALLSVHRVGTQSGHWYTWVGTDKFQNAFFSVHRVGTQSGCAYTWVGTEWAHRVGVRMLERAHGKFQNAFLSVHKFEWCTRFVVHEIGARVEVHEIGGAWDWCTSTKFRQPGSGKCHVPWRYEMWHVP